MNAIKTLLQTCAGIKEGERLLLITDPSTEKVGELIAAEASKTAQAQCICIDALEVHGQEPSAEAASLMLESDVVFGLTKKSLAHTQARFNFSKQGGRYLSLPDYSLELLEHKSLCFDFGSLTDESKRIADALDQGSYVSIKTPLGTDFTCCLKGRTANACPGTALAKGELASPPDAETNIAPIEHESRGVIVVDASIPCDELGVLKSPITLTVTDGAIVDIKGEQAEILENLLATKGNAKSRILGELGIGLNPEAKICGIMLVDEGCRGTVHFGFGSNSTIGGTNAAPTHIDMIVTNPTVTVDGKKIILDGQITI